MSIIKKLLNYTLYIVLIGATTLLDLLIFEQSNTLMLQALLCAYIVTLIKSEQPTGVLLLFIGALTIESHILFSHVSYGLYIALFLIPLAMILRAWMDTLLAAAFISLGITLVLQEVLFIANQQTSSINILTLTGHFLINGLFLTIYWVFDKNGKQGNRSEQLF